MSAAAGNGFDHRAFPLERLLGSKRQQISLCLPARDEAATIGAILQAVMPLQRRGLLDQVAVIDDSSDETGEIARAHGAEVYDRRQLMPELGPLLGKGDAMWRSLPVLHGELVCFLDADTDGVGAHYVCGLLGPLLCGDGISLVKGYYRRPFRINGLTLDDEGGRVTELTARPLLRLFYPELASLRQPLAGEVAARRELLEHLPFVTGYGVDIGLLIDAYRTVGIEGIAQVDLDVRQNAHRPLSELGPMASEVLAAVASRLAREGRLRRTAFDAVTERPALADLRAAA